MTDFLWESNRAAEHSQRAQLDSAPVLRDFAKAMSKRSAGLLPFCRRQTGLEVFLVHPGGPFWANKDLGAWSIAKGEYAEDEQPLKAAKREFTEETGFMAAGDFIDLGEVKLPSGKLVTVWAFEGDFDADLLTSNTFLLEWPPRSGREIEIPEVNRGAWFGLETARDRLFKGQLPFLDRLEKRIP